ncbi:Uncharacterized protein GBIM_03959 [Gryllus bimaculatus]|nr:Uncharacterized protein GBIM_03959 [Gryllus bimaculatus]
MPLGHRRRRAAPATCRCRPCLRRAQGPGHRSRAASRCPGSAPRLRLRPRHPRHPRHRRSPGVYIAGWPSASGRRRWVTLLLPPAPSALSRPHITSRPLTSPHLPPTPFFRRCLAGLERVAFSALAESQHTARGIRGISMQWLRTSGGRSRISKFCGAGSGRSTCAGCPVLDSRDRGVGIQKQARDFAVRNRLYISNFAEERRQLLEVVGPELQSKYDHIGLEVELVDMHFGAETDPSLDAPLFEDHLHEVRACHRVSRGCFFMCLVGNKYGPVPLPARLDGDVYEALYAAAVDMGLKAGLLDTWYGRNDTAYREFFFYRNHFYCYCVMLSLKMLYKKK